MTPTGAASTSPHFPPPQYQQQPGNYRPMASPQQFAGGPRAAYGSSGSSSSSTGAFI
jgi:hypothetical protein